MILNGISYVLPVMISLLAFITRKMIVNSQDGEKYAKRETCLDLIKVIAITSIALYANYTYGKSIPIIFLSIDVFMLVIYLLPIVQKKYTYVERKALMGVLAGLLITIIVLITITKMLLEIYDKNNPILLLVFLKAVFYLGISVWSCYSADKKFFSKAKKEISKAQYFELALLSLFLFTGYNNFFYPVCVFGIHEILNKKKIKGIFYIILGNACLYLQYKYIIVGVIPQTIYLLVAIIDLILQYRKNKE